MFVVIAETFPDIPDAQTACPLKLFFIFLCFLLARLRTDTFTIYPTCRKDEKMRHMEPKIWNLSVYIFFHYPIYPIINFPAKL